MTKIETFALAFALSLSLAACGGAANTNSAAATAAAGESVSAGSAGMTGDTGVSGMTGGSANTAGGDAGTAGDSADAFPSFEGQDLDGNPVDSATLFSNNAVTVVNFWFTTCKPCVGELPDLEALHQELAKKGGTVIGINAFTLDGSTKDTNEAKSVLEQWALPTEIWRETIERLQRCQSIKTKIAAGEITSINDFITYNLDIRLFAADLLASADRLFIKHFYDALQSVTILDPTCGSGAFLFAAMNILEPLYEACIERMQEEPDYFKTQLAEISDKYRSNIQYFIFKSIILRNLYGVDIMVEATEIAKLRLFLKMVAVVDVDRRQPNLGLDPLPDIDFNIRCGNTLVGYANEEQLLETLRVNKVNSLFFEDEIAQFRQKIEDELNTISKTYNTFKC